jgi:aspartate aminotransferase
MITLSAHLPADATTSATRALNPVSRAMQGSLILQIAAEVRAFVAQGHPVCNLTVGDFDSRQFPIPRSLADGVTAAYDAGQTNYPPSEGIPELRKAIAGWYGRHLDLDISPDWVVVASGARPVMYATFRLFLEQHDELLFPVPSWNNGYYAQLCGARATPVPTRAVDNFFPTAESLASPLRRARVFSLNSPLNPTGTAITAAQLEPIARAVVAENRRRSADGTPALMWMWDQVYWRLTYGDTRHVHPCALVPEVTPYLVTVDAISKAFAATGLRVGWAVLPPVLAERMKALLGHVGAWAPRPEQFATARLLDDDEAASAYHLGFRAGLHERLRTLSTGLADLGVQHTMPQGAMYLSVRFDLFGRPGVDGTPMTTNEDIRRFLLHEAGLAVVPFQAFDLLEENGWFRMSVGAVSIADLEAAFVRLRRALAAVGPR